MEMTPEAREHFLRETATMPKGDWSTMWAELYGYVSEAAAMGEPLDAAVLERYMVELKRRYVTGPIVEWIRSRVGSVKPD